MNKFFTKISYVSIIFFVNIVLVLNTFAYDLNAIHYTTKDGLPHNYINSIYEDSDGFIWLGTRNGVCRYDGYTFKTYKTFLPDQTSFPTFTQRVIEADDGLIWAFGSYLNSYYYDGSEFKSYSNDFTFAYPDNNGNLWFILDEKLIKVEVRYADIVSDRNEVITTERIRLVCKERNNKIWVFRRFNYQQLINSSNGFYNTYEIPVNKQQNFKINDLKIDSDNNVWLSTFANGLIKFNAEDETWDNVTSNNDQLSDNHIYSVFETDTNTLWIGTMQGLDILDINTNNITHLDKNSPNFEVLSSDAVTSFYKDKRGTMFIGTRFGLYIQKMIKFTHYYMTDDKNSSIDNNVHGFYEDKNNNVWIISSGGLDKLIAKSNKVEHFSVDKIRNDWLAASPISISADNNDIWLGTWQGGLYKFGIADTTFRKFSHDYRDKNSLGENSVMSMFTDSHNNFWIGTWGGGLNLYNKKDQNFTRYLSILNDENSIVGNEISSIAEDRYGRLWVGTMKGLCFMVDKEKHIFNRFNFSETNQNTISNNQVTCLYTSGKTLWIGTTYGLNSMNLETFRVDRIYLKDGLPSNHIKAIIDDDKGNLWVSTNKGLAKIVIDNVTQKIKKIYTYSTYDGLQDNEFLDRSVYKAKNGDLFFGGTNGYNRFNPNEIKADTIRPISVFTSLKIDDINVNVGDSIHGKVVLKNLISRTESIILSYKHKMFSIEYAGINYADPQHIQYKYMLKGFDRDWKISDLHNRRATYTNINKGEYEFLLLTANADGIWGDNPLSLKIKIEPPFWRTTWFIILMYGLFGAVVFLFLEIRVRIIKNQRNVFEATVKERTSEILQQKNNLEKQQEEIKQQAARIAEMNVLLQKNNIELSDNIEGLSKARVMQKLLDYEEFKKIFPSEEYCYEYLIELKWKKGFNCIRCGSDDYSVEENSSRRCKSCNYKESITSGTIFHHLRFSIEKAIYILIVTSTGRKINISELSRTLDLRLKTVWNFHNKVKEEMSLLKSPIKSSEGWVSLIITPPKKHTKKFK